MSSRVAASEWHFSNLAKVFDTLLRMLSRAIALIVKYEQICKYLIAGGFVFVLNLTLLYVFTDIFHIYYITSTFLAFVIAFSTSFALQKLWTFKDRTHKHLHIQVPMYLTMQVANISINASLMYVFVEYLHIWYLLSQAIISFGLAMIIFVINKKLIFKNRDIVI